MLFYRVKQAASVGRKICGRNIALISMGKLSNFPAKTDESVKSHFTVWPLLCLCRTAIKLPQKVIY